MSCSDEKFNNTKIWFAFKDEYTESPYINWSSFIKSKDLGIIDEGSITNRVYKIIDEKKWSYNKIKYELV